MHRLIVIAKDSRFTCLMTRILFIFLFALTTALTQGQQAGESTLYGIIRDSQGKVVAAAGVHLQSKDGTQSLTTHADAQGSYKFAALQEGVYSLRVEMPGYGAAEISSLFLASKEVKNVDLTLALAKTRLEVNTAQLPKFFDEPQFTVAGVTDTTSLGGHGSDTIVRTRETLAKETASLGKAPSQSAATAETEKELREKLEHEPNDCETNHQLGKLLIANGKAREAIPYLERSSTTKPDDYQVAYDLAVANASAGNYAQARKNAQVLLARNDTAELHHLLGEVQEKLGNSLDAVHEYQRAAEMNPDEAYIFDWGSELLLHHAPEPAQEVFSRGTRLFPHSIRMLIGLGAAWFAQGSYDQAIQRICDASDLNPSDPTPYLFMGKIQSSQAKPPAGLVDKLHRFVTLHPESAEANYYYAVGLWKLREPQDIPAQVELLLRNATRLDPKLGAAWLQLGILHAEQHDFAKAISDYRQAIQAAPDLEEAHYRMAQAYRKTGKTEEGKAEIEIYNRMSKEFARRVERERHDIPQFVYTLRDQSPAELH
jgi:tetratricopeptide (TPR) repeat protein